MPESEFVDDDSEYEEDASKDEQTEIAGLEPADPDTIPPDEGDIGQAGLSEGARATPSLSGLALEQRRKARRRSVRAALLGLRNLSEVHYTQDALPRWEGIRNHLDASQGEFPAHSDCSSFATWCLWNGLKLQFEVEDVVNGSDWAAGFTGTMLNNGRRVHHVENVRPGDCVLYGTEWPGKHVAIVVGRQEDVPMVVSHGSEEGPFLLRYDYRSDVMQFRRYI
jgi:hypothetical protein